MPRYTYDSLFDKTELIGFRKTLANVKEKVSDVVSPLGWRARQAFGNGKEAARRMKHGWTYTDCWNYGGRAAIRAADICAYLRHAQYDSENAPDDDYMAKLEACEKVFRAYDSTESSLIDIVHSKVIDYISLQNKIEDMLANEVEPLWMWYGRTLMNPDSFIRPLPPSKPADIMREELAFARGEITYRDVENLPITELKRTSEVLSYFARSAHGYPDSYHTSGSSKELPGKGDNWENEQPSMLGFMINRGEAWRDEIWDRNGRFLQMRKRSEIGVDWCAYIEDIHEAADVLDMYVGWISPDIPTDDYTNKARKHVPANNTYLSLRESVKILDEETFKELDEGITERFDTIWHWLAVTGFNLSD